MVTPPGARFFAPWTGYVAKLGLRCSPSVMTGEPVSSKRRIVSLTAASKSASSASLEMRPAP